MTGVIVKDPHVPGRSRSSAARASLLRVLIEYLEGGDTVDQFLEQYSSPTREVAIAAIEEARLSLVSELK